MNFRTHLFRLLLFICDSGFLFLKTSSTAMANFFGLDKIKIVLDAIKFNGGLKGSVLKLMRYDDLKWGTLVGVDKHGNKYYQNDSFFYGKNRWVEYSNKYGYDYDGSCVSPEWFGWLHYKTDLLPSEDKTRPNHKWMSEPVENLTGTPNEYVPYSTTRPKIQAWVPPKMKK